MDAPTPIPACAPVERPPEAAPVVAPVVDDGGEEPVADGIDDVADTCAEPLPDAVAAEPVGVGDIVAAAASNAASELCQRIGTPSPMTEEDMANVLKIVSPRSQPAAPLLIPDT